MSSRTALEFTAAVILVLASVLSSWRLAPRNARATIVASSGLSNIVAMQPLLQTGERGAEGWVLLADGTIWKYDYYRASRDGVPAISPVDPSDSVTPTSVPVPVSEIQFWTPAGFTTYSGDIWTWDSDANSVFAWRNLGTPPGSPVPQGGASVGEVKSRFRIRG